MVQNLASAIAKCEVSQSFLKKQQTEEAKAEQQRLKKHRAMAKRAAAEECDAAWALKSSNNKLQPHKNLTIDPKSVRKKPPTKLTKFQQSVVVLRLLEVSLLLHPRRRLHHQNQLAHGQYAHLRNILSS
jgi:hypothetical protein